MNDYFDKVALMVEETRWFKLDQVNDMFRILRFDDLADFDIYFELEKAVDKALWRVREDYEKLDYRSVVQNYATYQNIDNKIEDLAREMRSAKRIYDQWGDGVFHVEPDQTKI